MSPVQAGEGTAFHGVWKPTGILVPPFSCFASGFIRNRSIASHRSVKLVAILS